MAKRSNPEFDPTRIVQPTASPVDVFVQPNMNWMIPDYSGQMQVADALSNLSPTLAALSATTRKAEQEAGILQAREALDAAGGDSVKEMALVNQAIEKQGFLAPYRYKAILEDYGYRQGLKWQAAMLNRLTDLADPQNPDGSPRDTTSYIAKVGQEEWQKLNLPSSPLVLRGATLARANAENQIRNQVANQHAVQVRERSAEALSGQVHRILDNRIDPTGTVAGVMGDSSEEPSRDASLKVVMEAYGKTLGYGEARRVLIQAVSTWVTTAAKDPNADMDLLEGVLGELEDGRIGGHDLPPDLLDELQVVKNGLRERNLEQQAQGFRLAPELLNAEIVSQGLLKGDFSESDIPRLAAGVVNNVSGLNAAQQRFGIKWTEERLRTFRVARMTVSDPDEMANLTTARINGTLTPELVLGKANVSATDKLALLQSIEAGQDKVWGALSAKLDFSMGDAMRGLNLSDPRVNGQVSQIREELNQQFLEWTKNQTVQATTDDLSRSVEVARLWKSWMEAQGSVLKAKIDTIRNGEAALDTFSRRVGLDLGPRILDAWLQQTSEGRAASDRLGGGEEVNSISETLLSRPELAQFTAFRSRFNATLRENIVPADLEVPNPEDLLVRALQKVDFGLPALAGRPPTVLSSVESVVDDVELRSAAASLAQTVPGTGEYAKINQDLQIKRAAARETADSLLLQVAPAYGTFAVATEAVRTAPRYLRHGWSVSPVPLTAADRTAFDAFAAEMEAGLSVYRPGESGFLNPSRTSTIGFATDRTFSAPYLVTPQGIVNSPRLSAETTYLSHQDDLRVMREALVSPPDDELTGQYLHALSVVRGIVGDLDAPTDDESFFALVRRETGMDFNPDLPGFSPKQMLYYSDLESLQADYDKFYDISQGLGAGFHRAVLQGNRFAYLMDTFRMSPPELLNMQLSLISLYRDGAPQPQRPAAPSPRPAAAPAPQPPAAIGTFGGQAD